MLVSNRECFRARARGLCRRAPLLSRTGIAAGLPNLLTGCWQVDETFISFTCFAGTWGTETAQQDAPRLRVNAGTFTDPEAVRLVPTTSRLGSGNPGCPTISLFDQLPFRTQALAPHRADGHAHVSRRPVPGPRVNASAAATRRARGNLGFELLLCLCRLWLFCAQRCGGRTSFTLSGGSSLDKHLVLSRTQLADNTRSKRCGLSKQQAIVAQPYATQPKWSAQSNAMQSSSIGSHSNKVHGLSSSPPLFPRSLLRVNIF